MTKEYDTISLDEIEDVMHKALRSISDALEERFTKVSDIEDEDEKTRETRFVLGLLSNHIGAFMASVAIQAMNDPENWIKHSFYEALEHLKHYRKDAFEALAKRSEESLTEH
jgi:hypothetical protein